MTQEVMFNTDFQRKVLKLFCGNLQFAAEASAFLKEEYFELQPLRLLFRLATKHVNTYEKEVDKSSMLVMVDDLCLKSGYDTEILKSLKEENDEVFGSSIGSEQFVVDQLVSFARRQELRAALLKSVDILKNGGEYEKVLKLVDNAVSIGSGHSEGLSFDDFDQLPERYRKVFAPENLVQTGFTEYDKAIGGGMGPGEVHTVMAPPKSGKTAFGVNVGAYNVLCCKEDEAVFHCTLEIPDLDAAARYALRLSGLTYDELLHGPADAYRAKMKRYYKYKPQLYINYWTEGSANALNLRAWISKKRAKTGKRPRLIIVDYDDCLVPVGGAGGKKEGEDLYGDGGKVYNDLKALADYFKCPVLTMAQPKREGREVVHKGDLLHYTHMAHSAKKAMKAHSISTLNFQDDQMDGIMLVDIVRRGLSGHRVYLRRDLARMFFMERRDFVDDVREEET